jgi:hypothetical protein
MYFNTKICLPYILSNSDRKKYLYFFHEEILDRLDVSQLVASHISLWARLHDLGSSPGASVSRLELSSFFLR